MHQAFHSSILQTLSTCWVQGLLQGSSCGEGGRQRVNNLVYKRSSDYFKYSGKNNKEGDVAVPGGGRRLLSLG